MQTQKNELYHYGRKGMKWGKNIFSKEDLKELWKKRITGEYYKEAAKPYESDTKRLRYRAKRNRYYGRLFSNSSNPQKWTLGGSRLDRATKYSQQARASEKRADRVIKNYYSKSLKGITESKTKRAKNWISTRPSAVKKKISDIKEKIVKAGSGKKTVTYPLSRDANKKKTKKSTVNSSSHYMSNY